MQRKAKKQTIKRVDLQAAEGRRWSVCLMHTRGGAGGMRQVGVSRKVPYGSITRGKKRNTLSHTPKKGTFSHPSPTISIMACYYRDWQRSYSYSSASGDPAVPLVTSSILFLCFVVAATSFIAGIFYFLCVFWVCFGLVGGLRVA